MYKPTLELIQAKDQARDLVNDQSAINPQDVRYHPIFRAVNLQIFFASFHLSKAT